MAANSESFYKHSAYDTMRSSKQISITNRGLLSNYIWTKGRPKYRTKLLFNLIKYIYD